MAKFCNLRVANERTLNGTELEAYLRPRLYVSVSDQLLHESADARIESAVVSEGLNDFVVFRLLCFVLNIRTGKLFARKSAVYAGVTASVFCLLKPGVFGD